jgi:hypothetical protein
MNLRVPQNFGKLLSSWATGSLSRRTQLHKDIPLNLQYSKNTFFGGNINIERKINLNDFQREVLSPMQNILSNWIREQDSHRSSVASSNVFRNDREGPLTLSNQTWNVTLVQ